MAEYWQCFDFCNVAPLTFQPRWHNATQAVLCPISTDLNSYLFQLHGYHISHAYLVTIRKRTNCLYSSAGIQDSPVTEYLVDRMYHSSLTASFIFYMALRFHSDIYI